MIRMFANAVAMRLRRFNVTALQDDDGAIRFFVPTPGNFQRPTPADEPQRWQEDGAIRELISLVNSIPDLKPAVAAKLSVKEPEGGRIDLQGLVDAT